ncbi:MAG: type I methionyl aminopeptidase [bacterium]|nr:type I methionyl aminopeptidase [bacterium]
MALIKTPTQLNLIRQAGQKLARVLVDIKTSVKPGVTTLALDQQIGNLISKERATPSFLHYEGYPYTTCISVNEQVIHAFPSTYQLKEGDIVTIDVGLWYKRVCVDAARTYAAGAISDTNRTLLTTTQKALQAGIAQAQVGQRIGAVSSAIQAVAQANKLGIVRSYTGHGVGTAVHEDPSVPNIGVKTDGPQIRAGMVLAIEPMFTLGSGDVYTENDGWTVVTVDKSWAAQFEDTVIVTPQGPEIVTRLLHKVKKSDIV